MSITVREKPESRKVTEAENPSENRASLLYTASGSIDESAIILAVAAESPTSFRNMPRRSIDADCLGANVWDATVNYANKDTTQPGYSSYEFETGGGTQHITQAREHIQGYYLSTDAAAPDFHGAIGVTGDEVEGCDIVVPVYQFSERHIMNASRVTPAYKANLYFLTGRTNNASFKGFDAGEVLFMGAQGSKRGYDDWEISFKFAASQNVTGLTIGDLTGIEKKGWEYLWVLYEDKVDAIAKYKVKRPRAVYIERVYNAGDFSLLRIG